MVIKYKNVIQASVSAACLLTTKAAWAQSSSNFDLVSNVLPLMIATALGVGIGALFYKGKHKNSSDNTLQSQRYLAAIERISQGFTLFLRSPEKSTPQQALEWLLREAAKTLDVSRASVWFYEANQSSLHLKYIFDAGATTNPIDLSLSKKDQSVFLTTIRGERTVAFEDAHNDIRCADYINLLPQNDLPKSLLVAHIGVGKQAFGTFHIIKRNEIRKWTDADHQFIGSIADLIAFYLSSRNLHAAQSALSESEARFKDMVDASSDWYWETGPTHRFTYISERFGILTGMHPSLLIGETRDLFLKDQSNKESVIEHWETLKKHKPFKDFQYQAQFGSNTRLVSINGKPFFDEKGHFLGYRGTGSDISEDAKFKNRFEEGINALPHGFSMWDSDDRLVMYNKEVLNLFPTLVAYLEQGLTYREFLALSEQKNAVVYNTPLSDEIIDTLVERHLSCGIRELELPDKRHLLIHERPTSEGGIVGIYTDVTSLKSRENELIESNKASEALSLSGNTLIHARNESFILSEICRIITDISKFDTTWVSLLNTPGHMPEFLNINMHKGLDLNFSSHKPSSTLKQLFIKQEYSLFSENVLLQAFPNLRKNIEKHGIKAAAIFPIRIDTNIAGFLNVASKTPLVFNDKNINLLEELANDIGYGLSSLRSEQSRLQAEESLKESESRYRSLVDMSPDAILVLDENERIVFANPEGHALFATKHRSEILNKRFLNYVCDEIELFESNEDNEENDSERTYTSILLRKLDDTTFEADITTRPVQFGGMETHLLIIRDVTERNRVNEHLAQTSKLATLGEMAAGITHELSQPLNIMRFAAEGSLLKMERDNITEEQIKTQFDLISLQSERMADIIDHMRVFSRKDTGTIEFFDPALVIRQSMDMVEAQYYAEDIHLEVRYPPYYEMLKGRPIQLEQVILNLITNAHDAIIQRQKKIRDTGEEDNEVKRIHVTMTFDQADHKINIAITDNGGGIPEDALSKLFDPFFTTKEVGKGTGLGLSVSYGIIAAMGGKIQVKNIHHGARFDITLPCAITKETQEYLLDTPSKDNIDEEIEDLELDIDPNAHSVLVVDDEVYAAEAMMEYLFSHGFQVNMAGDGEEALELFDAEPTDVVVTDIRMPKMDGYTLIKHLKQRNPDIPVIVVTGHTGMDDVDTGNINKQAFAVLKKPVSLSELASQVEKAALLSKEK